MSVATPVSNVVNKGNGAVAAGAQPSYDELKARIAQLEAQASKPGELVIRINEKNADGTPGKGTISVYGLGRFPLSLYAEQWERFLTPGNVAKVLEVCKSPKASRKLKA